MITVLITIIVAGLAWYFFTYYALSCFSQEPEEVLWSICFGICVGLPIGILISYAIGGKTEPYEKEVHYLEALQDNSGVDGNFFLGSGSIHAAMSYIYYYEDGESFKMGVVEYNMAKITYTNDKPKVITLGSKPTKDWINLFGTSVSKDTWVFCIPKGSIKNNFELDAK